MKNKTVWLKNGFWLLMAAVQIVFLCVVSLRGGGLLIDNDAGKVYTHMMAIWESGTLFVPDWQYITTMEVDCATILALPFYGLTHNPILAFWCANVLLLGIWAALIFTLVRRMGGSVARGALAVLAVLLPYEFTMLGYWNMLFLNASQYAIKVMLPLLLIVLLLAPERPRRRDWVLLAVYLAGTFLTGLSSGIYVAACGLAPVLCLAAYEWLKQRITATPYRLACVLGSVAATLAGLGVQSAFGIKTNAASMTLNTLDTMRDNAANCIIGFLRLFGAVPKEDLAVFSREGISTLLRMGLSGGLLVLALWVAMRVLSGSLPGVLQPGRYLAAIFWWNLAVLLATNTRYGDYYFEYRYHLMGAVPLLILAAFALPTFVAQPARLHRAAAAAGMAGMLVLALLVDTDAVGDIWMEDGTLGVNNPEREICGLVNTLDVEDVIVAAGSGTTEICGALDPTRRYITLTYRENQGAVLETWDGYLTDTDGASYDKPAAVVLDMREGADPLPYYLESQCEVVGKASGYLVLRTTGAPLVDGRSGFEYGDRAKDYPDSPWYTYTGELDNQRRLYTDPAGGEVMRSAKLLLHTDACITLNYQVEYQSDRVGTLQLWQGETMLSETEIPADQTQIQLDVPTGDGYYLSLLTEEGTQLMVESVEFEALA